MSANCDKVLHSSRYAITSPFGVIRSGGRKHLGTDCGTYGIKAPQFCPRNSAIVVNTVNEEKIGNSRGLYVNMQWESINRGLILQHLDSIYVKKGSVVGANTCIGTTGITGLDCNGNRVSTGIHAHIELYVISTGKRLDYNAWNMEEDMTEQETLALINKTLNGKYTETSDWAVEAWKWLEQQNLSDGSSPKGYLTREQAGSLYYRIYNEFLKK